MFTIGKQLKAKVSGILQGAAGGSGILQHSTAHEAGLLREHPPREGQERVGALEGWPERGPHASWCLQGASLALARKQPRMRLAVSPVLRPRGWSRLPRGWRRAATKVEAAARARRERAASASCQTASDQHAQCILAEAQAIARARISWANGNFIFSFLNGYLTASPKVRPLPQPQRTRPPRPSRPLPTVAPCARQAHQPQ